MCRANLEVRLAGLTPRPTCGIDPSLDRRLLVTRPVSCGGIDPAQFTAVRNCERTMRRSSSTARSSVQLPRRFPGHPGHGWTASGIAASIGVRDRSAVRVVDGMDRATRTDLLAAARDRLAPRHAVPDPLRHRPQRHGCVVRRRERLAPGDVHGDRELAVAHLAWRGRFGAAEDDVVAPHGHGDRWRRRQARKAPALPVPSAERRVWSARSRLESDRLRAGSS